MNKTFRFLTVGVSSLAAVVLVTAGIVNAQTGDVRIESTTSATLAAETENSVTGDVAVGRFGRHGAMLEDRAERLGITTDELQSEIESGKSWYQIAAEHGLTYAEEKADRLADVKSRLDDMVKVGYMTQAEADAAYGQAENSAMIGGGLGFGPHGFGRMR